MQQDDVIAPRLVREKLKVILRRYPRWQDSVVIEDFVTVHGDKAKPGELTIGVLRRLCDATH